MDLEKFEDQNKTNTTIIDVETAQEEEIREVYLAWHNIGEMDTAQ